MNDGQLAIFEAPTSGDTALLACAHRVPLPPQPKRTMDGWWRSLHCPTCGRNRQVVSVIYPHDRDAA